MDENEFENSSYIKKRTNKCIIERNDICIYSTKIYGRESFYISSNKYDIVDDTFAARFLDMPRQDYRKLMRKTYKGFLSGEGRIHFNSLKDAKDAFDVFEAIILIKKLEGKIV